jgi:hypothetical protein
MYSDIPVIRLTYTYSICFAYFRSARSIPERCLAQFRWLVQSRVPCRYIGVDIHETGKHECLWHWVGLHGLPMKFI